MEDKDTVSQGAIDGYKASRFEDAPTPEPTPRGLRASNTLETLRPRVIYCDEPDAGRGQAIPSNPGLDAGIVRKTDNPLPAYNVLPVDWPAAMETMGKQARRSDDDRLTRLEEQMDALLDRIALYNVKSSHKL
jgi:hypothetical protein